MRDGGEIVVLLAVVGIAALLWWKGVWGGSPAASTLFQAQNNLNFWNAPLPVPQVLDDTSGEYLPYEPYQTLQDLPVLDVLGEGY